MYRLVILTLKLSFVLLQERDKALVMAIDIFCKLARQMENSTHLVNK
jgi:hypothetical protein